MLWSVNVTVLFTQAVSALAVNWACGVSLTRMGPICPCVWSQGFCAVKVTFSWPPGRPQVLVLYVWFTTGGGGWLSVTLLPSPKLMMYVVPGELPATELI